MAKSPLARAIWRGRSPYRMATSTMVLGKFLIRGPSRKVNGKWPIAICLSCNQRSMPPSASLLATHQAFTDGDLETALSCYGDNYLTLFRGEGDVGDPTRWAAGNFATKESMRGGCLSFLPRIIFPMPAILNFCTRMCRVCPPWW